MPTITTPSVIAPAQHLAQAPVLCAFAATLRYPGEGGARAAQFLRDAASLLVGYPDAVAGLCTAAGEISAMTDDEVEETFTRTFDINPRVTLDVGFHLFGLAYQRGEFLVRVRAALREYGIAPGSELPDHLPVMLELAAALEPERAVPLIEECIAPAVMRMAQEFGANAVAYGRIASALHDYLKANFGCIVYDAKELARKGLNGENDHVTSAALDV